MTACRWFCYAFVAVAWRLSIPLHRDRVDSCSAFCAHSIMKPAKGKEHGVTGHCVLCRWAIAAGLHYSTWTEYCHFCDSPSRPTGAYATTDEDFVVLTCACSCE